MAALYIFPGVYGIPWERKREHINWLLPPLYSITEGQSGPHRYFAIPPGHYEARYVRAPNLLVWMFLRESVS